MDRFIYLGILDVGLVALSFLIIFKRVNFTKRWFVLTALGVFTLMVADFIFSSVALWQGYRADPVGQYWLPPHSNLVYLHITRLGQPLLVSLIVAAIVFIVLWFFQKRFNLAQYGTDDVYLLTIAALVSGWPGWFVTFMAIFLVAVVGSIIMHIIRRQTTTTPSSPLGLARGFDGRRPNPSSSEEGSAEAIRLIITPFILPVTAVMVWLLPYVNHVTGLEKIRF